MKPQLQNSSSNAAGESTDNGSRSLMANLLSRVFLYGAAATGIGALVAPKVTEELDGPMMAKVSGLLDSTLNPVQKLTSVHFNDDGTEFILEYPNGDVRHVATDNIELNSGGGDLRIKSEVGLDGISETIIVPAGTVITSKPNPIDNLSIAYNGVAIVERPGGAVDYYEQGAYSVVSGPGGNWFSQLVQGKGVTIHFDATQPSLASETSTANATPIAQTTKTEPGN